MNKNENTVYQGQETRTVTVGTKKNQPVKSANSSDQELWRNVTIGGVTGILVGAGAMYAGNAYATNTADASSAENIADAPEIQVSHVDDSLSFGEAFSVARAEVGPGGVFEWHGALYNTFTAEEWSAMSDADKNAFVAQVNPEIPASDVDVAQDFVAPEVEVQVVDVDVATASTPSYHETEKPEVTVEASNDANVQMTSNADSDVEVHFIGSAEVSVGNGQNIDVAAYEVDGHYSEAWDIDQDGNPDVLIVDINDNEVIDDGEVLDLNTGKLISMASDPVDSDAYMAGYDETPDNSGYGMQQDSDLGGDNAATDDLMTFDV